MYVLFSAIAANFVAISAAMCFASNRHPAHKWRLANFGLLPQQNSNSKTRNCPILIIRELISMENKTLLAYLSALERIKEDQIFFPVIMETSDSKWHQAPAVKKLRSAFQPYYVSEVSYKEGINEIVNKWKLF